MSAPPWRLRGDGVVSKTDASGATAPKKKGVAKTVSERVETGGFATWFAVGVGVLAIGLIWAIPADERSPAAIAAILQTGAILVGLLSLVLIARQIRTTAAQAAHVAAVNSALAYHQHFGDLITVEIKRQMAEVAERCGFKESRQKGEPISADAVKCLKDNPVHDSVVSCYLDEFEEFCGAIHAQLLNEDYAYGLEANRVIRAWAIFKPYVLNSRTETEDFRTYMELERVALRWKDRREAEDEEEANSARNRNAAKGVTSVLPQ